MELLHDSGIWVLVSFLIFAAFAFRFGKDALLAKLDGRIDDIKREIETAEGLRIEAQELLAQYQRKQRDAEKEAKEIVETAKKHANEVKKQADKDLKELMARREAQLAERLERMEKSAVDRIRAHAAELAVRATSELVAKEMNKKMDAALVDESIADLAKRVH